MSRPTVRGWLRTTTLGWLLGLVAIVVLAVVADLVGMRVQFIVGAGMGAGVGYVQARYLRSTVPATPWLWSTVIGLGAPFLAWDLGAMLRLGLAFDAPRCMLAGGLLTGLLQYRILRSHTTRAHLWVLVAAVAWALPAAALAVGDRQLLPPAASSALQLGTYLLGGALVGLVSAAPLVRLLDSASGAA